MGILGQYKLMQLAREDVFGFLIEECYILGSLSSIIDQGPQ